VQKGKADHHMMHTNILNQIILSATTINSAKDFTKVNDMIEMLFKDNIFT